MKALTILVLLSVAIATLASEEDVVVLTTSNFDEFVNSEELSLVEFYAPWCGHCKKLAPEYAIAAEELKKENPPIRLAKVDATVEGNLGTRFGVTGYPTMKVFRKGTPTDYKGPRDAPGIVNFMKKQSGPSAKPLKTLDEVKAFINKDRDVSYIGFFPTKNSDAESFLKVADSLREDFRFGYVTDKSALEGLNVKEGVSMFRGEKETTPFTGTPTLADWVWDVAVPKVGELTKDNFKRYQRKNLPILKLFMDVDWKSNLKQTNYYLNRLKKIAEHADLKDKLYFAIAHIGDFRDEMDKFSVTGQQLAVVIDDFANSLKYKFSGDFGVDKVIDFAKDFVSKKIKPYIKSEPIPEKNDDPVKVVVGETFNDIVLDTNKDVLIELYAPWCGHCKKLTPIYEELATSLSGVENLVIAKMDATANDTPHSKYQAKGYPTILFAPANNKNNPISYSGAREVKDFTDFLKKNAAGAKFNAKKEL